MDLHSGQCVGYFDIPVDHVYGDSVLLDYLASKRISTGDLVRQQSGVTLRLRNFCACVTLVEQLHGWLPWGGSAQEQFRARLGHCMRPTWSRKWETKSRTGAAMLHLACVPLRQSLPGSRAWSGT